MKYAPLFSLYLQYTGKIKSELLDEEREDKDASDMQDFESSVKIYEPEENDFDGLVRTLYLQYTGIMTITIQPSAS